MSFHFCVLFVFGLRYVLILIAVFDPLQKYGRIVTALLRDCYDSVTIDFTESEFTLHNKGEAIVLLVSCIGG
ncbi:hypothetical protein, partial [Porphyromonas loveana]|uniref:hypothetical protein n=1 Tax=Porphyromonas loveana TaxID=1884669 RepID=UPI00359F72CD